MPSRLYTLTYRVDTTQANHALDDLDRKLDGVAMSATRVGTASAAAGPAIQGMAGSTSGLAAQMAALKAQADAASLSLTTVAAASNTLSGGLGPMSVDVKHAEAGFMGMTGSMIAAQAAMAAIGATINVVAAMGEQANEARKKWAELAEDVMKVRDGLRELANLKGHAGPDDEVLGSTVAFGMAAGMKVEEATKFLEQYHGSSPAGLEKGNVGDGKKAGEAQEDYERRIEPISKEIALAGAKTGQRVGLAPKTAGDLTGVLAQYGKIESGTKAAQKVGQVVQGLNDGRGKVEDLTRGFIQTAGELVDENHGPVGDLSDLAALYGVMSTHKGTKAAGTYLKKGVRGLRDFSGKQAKALGQMGITPQMDHMAALGQLHKTLKAAEAKGQPMDQTLQVMGFTDAAENEALINETRDYEIAQQRIAKNKQITGKEVEAKNDAFQTKDLTGVKKKLDAAEQGAKILKGREHEEMQLARQAAAIRMRDAGNLGGTELILADKIADAGGIFPALGIPDAFGQRVDEEAAAGTERAARQAGMGDKVDRYKSEMNEQSPDERQATQRKMTNELHPQLRAAGQDPTPTGGVKAKVGELALPEAEKKRREAAKQGNAPAPAWTPKKVAAGPGLDNYAGDGLVARANRTADWVMGKITFGLLGGDERNKAGERMVTPAQKAKEEAARAKTDREHREHEQKGAAEFRKEFGHAPSPVEAPAPRAAAAAAAAGVKKAAVAGPAAGPETPATAAAGGPGAGMDRAVALLESLVQATHHQTERVVGALDGGGGLPDSGGGYGTPYRA